MSAPITKETLEHLTELSKMTFDQSKEEKLLQDLQRILEYFQDLEAVDTDSIIPSIGGSFNKNVVRPDESRDEFIEENLLEQFPDAHGTLLCVPPVFEQNDTP